MFLSYLTVNVFFMITARPSWMLTLSAVLLGIVACEDVPAAHAKRDVTTQLDTAKPAALHRAVMVGDLEVRVLPDPRLPRELMASKASAKCDATFDVTADGLAENVSVTCDNDAYKPAVENAMTRARFAPEAKTGAQMPFNFDAID